MTVNTIIITSGPYTGNALSDQYSYDFRVKDKTQLSVYETNNAGLRTLLTVDTDYTVAGIGDAGGGIITRVAGNLPTGYIWYIRSNYVETQLTAFNSQGGFFPGAHEDQFDHQTFLVQQILDTRERSFRLSDEVDIDGDFTIDDDAGGRAGKTLSFDSNGDLEAIQLSVSLLSDSVIVANKTTAAALTLIASDAGTKIFITSEDGGEFTVRYNATAGTYKDRAGAKCGDEFIPSGGDGTIGIVRDRPSSGLADGSGLGDVTVDDAIFIAVGDSTTQLMTAAGGGASRLRELRYAGGPLEKIAAMFNLGSSGQTLESFVNGALDVGFTGPSIGVWAGVGVWDSWMNTAGLSSSLPTAIQFRETFTNKVIWSICFGINDLILYATGQLSQQDIVDYLTPLLRKAILAIQTTNPKDLIMLRMPNPMTARPISGSFPSAAAAPNWGAVLGDDEALVELWNQALRQTYVEVQGDYPRTVLVDVWKDVFGDSDTTLIAGTELPYLVDMVHPGSVGYAGVAEAYVKHLTPQYTLASARKRESELRSALLGNDNWEVWPGYFKDNKLYTKIMDAELVAIGTTYIDFSISYDDFQKQPEKGLYIEIEGVGTQYFATYTASALGANTRLIGVTPTTELQSAASGLSMSIYQNNGSLIADDSYINGIVKSVKNYFTGVFTTSGAGYMRLVFDANKDRMSTEFARGVQISSIAVGDGIDTTLDLSTLTGISQIGAASIRQLQVNIAGDYTSWIGKPFALYFDDDRPSALAFEEVRLSAQSTHATANTSTSYPHGLGYKPLQVNLLPRGQSHVYQIGLPDATNIYVASPGVNILFDAYVK